ncbi:hypothetical protein [Tropicimonas sp. IMCC6043]|uniref:hypothetical protein n=1 Tax=Tropicimonas sp. IMCC6043 TaxID=2510645 RepID=UPI00101CA367|nr:hypothetical protein [Tropicimonas sp. IMCC6043]RYH06630.1 hypothetical protein EU800_23130 [Tropicimonas sp. IMCC6043]
MPDNNQFHSFDMTIANRTSIVLLPTLSGLVILISCLGSFVGLDASSLWTDELFSAYFADPTLPTFGEALTRAAEDVNPPGYYLLLWAILRGTGLDIETGSRGFSAVLGGLAILAVVVAPTKGVGTAPRLLAGAFAATSTVWFIYTQEARAYAFVLLLVAGMLASALRCIDDLLVGRTPVLPLAALALLSLVAGLSHYYSILLAGGLFTILLLFCRSFRALAGVVIAGFSVLFLFLAFLIWHQAQVIIDIHNTWFSASFESLKHTTLYGLRRLIGTRRSQLMILVLAGLAVWSLLARGRRQSWATFVRAHVAAALLLLIGSFLLAYLYALGVTLVFTPMLSERLFTVLAPVVWVALAYGAHVVLTLMNGPLRAPAAAMSLSLTVVLSGTMVLNRAKDSKEPWRHSANAVASFEGCTGATLPVVWWEQPYFREDDPERFYGFYLPPNPDRKWLPINRDDLLTDLVRPEVQALVQDTAMGRRTCQLLLWSVHMRIRDPEAITEALAATLAGKARANDISVTIVNPKDGRSPAYLFVLQPLSAADLR